MAYVYEIFSIEQNAIDKSTAINTLFEYPNAETKTLRYREVLKHPTLDTWAACVGNDLIVACDSLPAEDRVKYYDDSDLKSYQYLTENNWFEEE